MANINLLPWRQKRREERQKGFYALLGASALFAGIIAFGVINYYGRVIDAQSEKNSYLDQQIKSLEVQIKEVEKVEAELADLIQRKKVIEELQASRSQMVHLFDELVRTIPDGVRLSSIKQNGNELTLAGTAQSNARVSSYIRSLEQSGWVTGPTLDIIEAKGVDRTMPFEFTLKVSLTVPKPPTADGAPESVEIAGGSQ